jgi:serine/threonine protein kinase
MDRMAGSVHDLIGEGVFTRNEKGQPELQNALLKDFMHQMLSALDYMAARSYVHRDIKPANILWNKRSDGKYHYVLGDFGLANAASNAITFCGTHMYMAPEIANGGAQSSKSDIYSLFATVADMIGSIDHGYRRRGSEARHWQRLVQAAKSHYSLLPIATMAEINPDKRPSVAQLLDQFWQGRGRTLLPPSNTAIPAARADEDIAMIEAADAVHTKLMEHNIVMPRVRVR